MTDRKSLTDALQNLNEDDVHGREAAVPAAAKPTPMTPRSTASPLPDAQASRRAPKGEPQAAPVTMNILLPRKLHRRLRHSAVDSDHAARDIAIVAIVEYLDNHEGDHQ